MVLRAGLEPTTLCLEGRCSIQLSYRSKSSESNHAEAHVAAKKKSALLSESFSATNAVHRINIPYPLKKSNRFLKKRPRLILINDRAVKMDREESGRKHFSRQQGIYPGM